MMGDKKDNNIIMVVIVVVVIIIVWQCTQKKRNKNQEGFTVAGYDTCSPSIAVPYACASLGSCGRCGGQNSVSGMPFKNSQQYGWEALDNTLFNAVYSNTSARAPGYSTSCGSNCCGMCATGNGTSMAQGSCGYGSGYDM